jgi:MoaA/NifB/PqqE/SkfB family radical SAM enzyme
VLELLLNDRKKKRRYLRSFLTRRLVHVNLQLLYSCNFRCAICDYWKDPYPSYPRLSAAQIKLISDKLARVGPQVVSIGGGEPLLHPEIVEVVEALAEHHFPVMICNGWYITPERARELWRAGMYEISVSVDYADAAKHDAQRGVQGAHARALAALEVLHDTRDNPEQRVHMISVVMDDNLDEIEPLILRCREMGITYLVTLYSDGRGEKETRPVPVDVSARLLELKRRYPEFVVLESYIERFSQAIAEGGIANCRAGKNLCNIDSQGDVSLCIDRLDAAVGNILDDDIEELIERLAQRQRQDACKQCWTSCRGAIETMMYGKRPLQNLRDYWALTKPVALS